MTLDEIMKTIENYEARNREFQKKIDKLEPVYKNLREIKKEFKKEKRKMIEIFDDKDIEWRGEKYESFCRAGEDLEKSLNEYYKRLDNALDAINTEIGNLEAEKTNGLGMIDYLNDMYQAMKTSVENTFN